MTIGQTDAGYSYPKGDDPIRNGDNVITQLAEEIGDHQASSFSASGGGASLGSGGGTLGLIGAVSIPAVPYRRILVINGRMMCTSLASSADLIFRNGTTEIQRAKVGIVNQSVTLATVIDLPAGTGYSPAFIVSSSSTANITGDPRYTRMDVLILPAAP